MDNVPQKGIWGTCLSTYVPENGISGTYIGTSSPITLLYAL